jgi:Holliday junction resolvasome RuvABC endonuclease subunit
MTPEQYRARLGEAKRKRVAAIAGPIRKVKQTEASMLAPGPYPIFLGIDPGLECTGWAILNAARQCVAFGGVKSDARHDDRERIAEIEEGLIGLFRAERYGLVVHLASVEQYVYQGKHSESRNAFRVSRLVGSLETRLRCEGLRVVGYTRGEGLTAIGCRHNAAEAMAKSAIIRRVESGGGLFPSNEHSRAAYAQAYRAQAIAVQHPAR